MKGIILDLDYVTTVKKDLRSVIGYNDHETASG
jgi:hypothetical protein